jgi:hypothetical protein
MVIRSCFDSKINAKVKIKKKFFFLDAEARKAEAPSFHLLLAKI